jgi:penicillin V acylase-like amidase (Ntn superfamily)
MRKPFRVDLAATRTLAAIVSAAMLWTSAAQACTSFLLTAKDGSKTYGWSSAST